MPARVRSRTVSRKEITAESRRNRKDMPPRRHAIIETADGYAVFSVTGARRLSQPGSKTKALEDFAAIESGLTLATKPKAPKTVVEKIRVLKSKGYKAVEVSPGNWEIVEPFKKTSITNAYRDKDDAWKAAARVEF